MVELQRKLKMAAASEIPSPARISPSPLLLTNKKKSSKSSNPPLDLPAAPSAAIIAYEQYLGLSELSKLSSSRDFPAWENEPILKPALQALEITFRLISISLSDPRPYSNKQQWKQRLESLACRQVEIIALLCQQDSSNTNVPTTDLMAPNGVMAREKSSQEVWSLKGTSSSSSSSSSSSAVISHTSEASLLPRLASWDKSEDIANRILLQIECQMHRCPFTLGLGEPNLSGKPTLEYDDIVRPSDLHAIYNNKKSSNYENQMLFSIHQILESWLRTTLQLLERITERIDNGSHELEEAASDAWLLERLWKLLSEVEHLHLLMDPADFLRLKSQLAITTTSSNYSSSSSSSELMAAAFCFRSRGLVEASKLSKELKQKVPGILGVEVDPKGGPRVQEAGMKLFHSRRSSGIRIHLLQAFQAVEVAVKEFFFGYRLLVTAVMGSLEANGNRGLSHDSMDSLTQMFMDPPYFPSVDAAKTFLGELIWHQEYSTRSRRTTGG